MYEQSLIHMNIQIGNEEKTVDRYVDEYTSKMI